jgi:hypothetical protein
MNEPQRRRAAVCSRVRALARLLGRRHHEACTAPFRRFSGPIIVPAPIVTEVAYERRSAAVTSNIHSSRFDSIMPKTLATATEVEGLP